MLKLLREGRIHDAFIIMNTKNINETDGDNFDSIIGLLINIGPLNNHFCDNFIGLLSHLNSTKETFITKVRMANSKISQYNEQLLVMNDKLENEVLSANMRIDKMDKKKYMLDEEVYNLKKEINELTNKVNSKKEVVDEIMISGKMNTIKNKLLFNNSEKVGSLENLGKDIEKLDKRLDENPLEVVIVRLESLKRMRVINKESPKISKPQILGDVVTGELEPLFVKGNEELVEEFEQFDLSNANDIQKTAFFNEISRYLSIKGRSILANMLNGTILCNEVAEQVIMGNFDPMGFITFEKLNAFYAMHDIQLDMAVYKITFLRNGFEYTAYQLSNSFAERIIRKLVDVSLMDSYYSGKL